MSRYGNYPNPDVINNYKKRLEQFKNDKKHLNNEIKQIKWYINSHKKRPIANILLIIILAPIAYMFDAWDYITNKLKKNDTKKNI
jgi:hypothetical protein